jgi:hypothetical protein
MWQMIERMFERGKFGAEFPSAAQGPILLNSLRNVHSTISRADGTRRSSVTSGTTPVEGANGRSARVKGANGGPLGR